MSKNLSLFSYYGGKSPLSSKKLSQWINSHLPRWHKDQAYCEPFAGMLGVLLNKRKNNIEIVNDSSTRLIDLWTAIRDHPEEMFRLLDATPISEAEFNRAKKEVDQLEGLERALAVAIIIRQGLQHSPSATSFKRNFSSTKLSPIVRRHSLEEFQAIYQRVKDVQFLNTDALWILDRIKNTENFVIYCDPPYLNASTTSYGDNQVDHAELKKLLKAQKGKVLLSGYQFGGEFYDDLGWYKYEKETHNYAFEFKGRPRIETLWCNYPPEKTSPSLFPDYEEEG